MKKPMSSFISATFILGLAFCAGCGGQDESLVAPPPPPAASPVTMTTPEVAPPDTANPADAAPAPTPTVEELTKNMTPQQLEDFKAGTTIETHDLNLAPLNEAVTGFEAEFRRIPTSQEEMVKARYLPRVLQAPKGKRYVINQESGEVTVE